MPPGWSGFTQDAANLGKLVAVTSHSKIRNEQRGERLNNKSTRRIFLLVIAGGILLVAIVLVGGSLLVRTALTSFETHRSKMCIREDLDVSEPILRYLPGMDAAMWCRFSVHASGIDEVFDTSRVNTTEFDETGYTFRVEWIDDEWWDVADQNLTGGEVPIGQDFMRVGYIDHGDGTLTVYIFWFEV